MLLAGPPPPQVEAIVFMMSFESMSIYFSYCCLPCGPMSHQCGSCAFVNTPSVLRPSPFLSTTPLPPSTTVVVTSSLSAPLFLPLPHPSSSPPPPPSPLFYASSSVPPPPASVFSLSLSSLAYVSLPPSSPSPPTYSTTSFPFCPCLSSCRSARVLASTGGDGTQGAGGAHHEGHAQRPEDHVRRRGRRSTWCYPRRHHLYCRGKGNGINPTLSLHKLACMRKLAQSCFLAQPCYFHEKIHSFTF